VDRALAVLVSGARDAPERQRTLRTTICGAQVIQIGAQICASPPPATPHLPQPATSWRLRRSPPERHSCALLAAGNVACWGSNVNGAVGNGNAEDSLVPVLVTSIG
jgi:hypothetical protein